MQRAGASACIRLPGRGDTHGAAGIVAVAGERGLSGCLQRPRTGATETAETATQDQAARQPRAETPVSAG